MKAMNRFVLLLSGLCLLSGVARADLIDSQRADLARIFKKVTGFKLNENLKVYPDLKASFETLGPEKFAESLTQTKAFESTRLMSFVSKFSQRETEPNFAVTDDIQTTLLGYIVNDEDFRLSLTGGHTYSRYNNGFAILGPNAFPLKKKLEKSDGNKVTRDGIQGTNRFAAMNYTGGTNRRQIKYIFEKFLCTPIDHWKNPVLSNYFIRMDIDRNPGKDSTIFEGQCRSCHAPMDAMAGAHVNYNDRGGTEKSPQAKTLNFLKSNVDGGVQGNAPIDNYWMNLLTTPKDMAYFGWRGPENGFGAHSFGEEITNSKRFQLCMVQRVEKELCDSPVSEQESGRLAMAFEQSKYNLRTLFATVALSRECK
jgi:hypothetical protein